MASTNYYSSTLTAPGAAANMQIQNSTKQSRYTFTGTYTGVVGTIQVSQDNATWVNLLGQREDTGASFISSVGATNFSVLVNTSGWGYSQFTCTAIASGTLSVRQDQGTYSLPPGVTPISLSAVGTTITSTSANAFVVGANGTTNPAFNVDASASSVATGFNVQGQAAGSGLNLSVVSSGTNENLTINAKGSGTVTVNGTATGRVLLGTATTITAASATAFVVGANGATNPVLTINSNTASVATGVAITGAAAGSGVAETVTSSGTNENLTINAKGSGTISLNGTATGAVTVGSLLTVTSTSANALCVGANGTTNPVLTVNASTSSVATGISVTGAAAASGVAIAVTSSGTNESLTVDAKGSGSITVGGTSSGQISIGRGKANVPIFSSTKTAIATQNITPTAAQLLSGYINHASTTGAGTCTFPTGTNIDSAISSVATGDNFEVTYVNSGTQTVTLTTATGLTLLGTVAVPSGKNATCQFFRTGTATYDVAIVVSA